MKEKLTQNEILGIKSRLKFYDEMGLKMLKQAVLVLSLGSLYFYYRYNSLIMTFLQFLFLSIVCLISWFFVFGNNRFKTAQDLKDGLKEINETTIIKTIKKKDDVFYILENGVKVSSYDFESEGIDLNKINIGNHVLVTYTLYSKYILKINLIE